MAKNIKGQKIRSYKMQYDGEGVPYLHIKGKFLQPLDMETNPRFEMTETDNLFILRKVSAVESSIKERSRWRTTYKRLFNLCERQIEGCRPNELVSYNDQERLICHLKECGQSVLTLYVLSLDEQRKDKVLQLINECTKQLAQCEHSFLEYGRRILTSFDLEMYTQLLELLKDCGQQLGIFSRRKLFAFKKRRPVAKMPRPSFSAINDCLPAMRVAEHSPTYSVEEEIANHPKKYSQYNPN